MFELIGIIIPLVFLSIYMIGSSIEFGASFFLLFPTILHDERILTKYLQPVWEVTNVFLVFTIICLFTFFPKSSFFLGTNLIIPLFLFLLLMGIRAACMLGIFYAGTKSLLVRYLFFLSCFGAPMILSTAFVYIITGDSSHLFTSSLSFPLYSLVASSILLISSTFFQWLYPRKNSKSALSRVIGISLIAVVGSSVGLLSILMGTSPWMFSNILLVVLSIGISISVLIGLVFCYVYNRYYWGFLLSSLLVLSVFLSLALMHLPFLIYPEVTIYNAFTNHETFKIMLLSYGIGMIFVIPSLILLYSLFIKKR